MAAAVRTLMSIRGLIIGPTWFFLYSDILSTLPWFLGGKSAKFGITFLHHSPSNRPRFEDEQNIWNLKRTCRASMIALCPLQIWYSSAHTSLRSIRRFEPLKTARRNFAKFSQWLKFTYLDIQCGSHPSPNFQSLNRYISAANCSILLKFGTEVDHVTANGLQTFQSQRVNSSGDSVT